MEGVNVIGTEVWRAEYRLCGGGPGLLLLLEH